MIYIDAGYYIGNALKTYREKGIVDDSWTIYAFEANPQLEVPDFVRREAVWTHDKGVVFQIGGRNDASSIVGTGGHGDPILVKAASLDFSKFVAGLPDEFTICSLDVEGAEFAILDKMLKDGTIDKIDILDVEFHHRLMAHKTLEDAQELLIKLLTKTAVRLKVDLI